MLTSSAISPETTIENYTVKIGSILNTTSEYFLDSLSSSQMISSTTLTPTYLTTTQIPNKKNDSNAPIIAGIVVTFIVLSILILITFMILCFAKHFSKTCGPVFHISKYSAW